MAVIPVVCVGGKVVRFDQISSGSMAEGAKEREDDGRTPEVSHVTDYRQADSGYHPALLASFQGPHNRRAKELGFLPGGGTIVHGLPDGLGRIGRSHRFHDWTERGVALKGGEIDAFWCAVPVGTPAASEP